MAGPLTASHSEAKKSDKAAVPQRSFTQAAKEHVEPVFDTNFTPGANQTNLGTFEIPAAGFLRHVVFVVEATGGTGTAAVAKADAPWTAFAEVTLTDVNGQPLFGPLSGYELYLAHLLGGYSFDCDPTRSPAYTAMTTAGNFSFLLRLPVEINGREGLGALANTNASSTYRLRVTAGSLADIYGTNPTGVPVIRVRAYIETWTSPSTGETPPFSGTTQYWSKQIINSQSGQQTWRLLRVGNAIRNLVFITRDSTGARVATSMPDPVQVMLDGRLLATLPVKLLSHYLQERYGITGANIPTGVYVLDFTHDLDGKAGFELRDGWLATSSATRLELTGVAGAGAAGGTVMVLTNDVASFASQGA